MSKWYNRKGELLVDFDWYETDPKKWKKSMLETEELLTNFKYKVVKQEHLWWGAFLSTVWLGLDMSWYPEDSPNHRPLIFESMLFPDELGEEDMDRYSTEEEALEGHNRMKKEWSNPLKHPIILKGLFRKLFKRIWKL